MRCRTFEIGGLKMKLLIGLVFLALIIFFSVPTGVIISFLSLLFLILTPLILIYIVWFKPFLFSK